MAWRAGAAETVFRVEAKAPASVAKSCEPQLGAVFAELHGRIRNQS